MGLFCFAFKVNYGPGRDKSPAHICRVSLGNPALAIFMKMALHQDSPGHGDTGDRPGRRLPIKHLQRATI